MNNQFKWVSCYWHTFTFPDLLAENGRLSNTPGVVSAFSTIMSVHRGEVPCTVTTASVSNGLSLLHWPWHSMHHTLQNKKKKNRLKLRNWERWLVTWEVRFILIPASVSLNLEMAIVHLVASLTSGGSWGLQTGLECCRNQWFMFHCRWDLVCKYHIE